MDPALPRHSTHLFAPSPCPSLMNTLPWSAHAK